MDSLIFNIIFFPILGSLFIFFWPSLSIKQVKELSLIFSIITFLLSILIWIFFDNSCSKFQFIDTFFWVNSFNIYFSLGIDGVSLFFVLLTTFLTPICLLSSWTIPCKNLLDSRYFFGAFLILESFVLIVFCSLDLLLFYTFFESVLIPIFFIIGIWGSRRRKIRASYLFFLYTLFGSLFMLLGIILIFFEIGTTDYLVILNNDFSLSRQKILWLVFFFSFAVKVPIVPVHLWLPEAHVEAPTAGSVILAGILLKLGTYGFIRFSLSLFPIAAFFFRPLIFVLSVIAVIYTSLTAIRQTDMKRVIAYASVAHINITLLGVFSFNIYGLEGSIVQIISHGLVSGALFLCVGVLYERHHSRLISYYSGLTHTMPFFVIFFLFFTISNIALPGSSSFIGEFLILVGIFESNKTAAFFQLQV